LNARPAVLALLALALLASCGAPRDPTPPDLRARIDSLQGVVEGLRGLRFLRPVQGRLVSRARLLEVYDSTSFETGDPADTALLSLQGAFGFIDSIDQDSGVVDSVDRESIDAFYARGVLWVVDDVDRDSGELDATVVHELVHALQDQHWRMEARMAAAPGLDERTALQYLMEGEARLVETMYRIRDRDTLVAHLPAVPLDAYRDSLDATGSLDPELVTIPIFHPYEQGAHVLLRRWLAGGWAAIDAWWRSPPRTTRCFLDPAMPCTEPPPLPLEPLVALPSPWKRIHRGRLGTLHTDILFSIWRESAQWLSPDSLRSGALLREGRDLSPDSVVHGMVSDSFALWEDDSGSLVLAWRTRWETAGAASRFLEAWSRLLVRKQRGDVVVRRARGDLLLARDPDYGVWDRGERFDDEVWIVEGAPGVSPVAFATAVRSVRGGATERP